MKQQEMPDTKHNGWTNYATWRINLEIFDGYDPEGTAVSADSLRELADEIVFSGFENGAHGRRKLACGYAEAFMSDVNWHEIAESINEIQKQDVWEA